VTKTLLAILRRIIREVLTPPALLIAALLFLWEEVLWVWLGRGMARLGRLPMVAGVETTIRNLSPYSALALFMVPFALTYPPKIGALWLIATGHFWIGVCLLIALEVLAAAILARVYHLCQKALRTLRWFAWCEAILLRWSAWAHRRFHWRRLRDAVQEAANETRAADAPYDNGGGLT
jgi:hypothetical protein